MIKNRKGQIVLAFMFLMAIALALIALMSFSSIDRNAGSISVQNSRLISSVNFGEQYVIETCKAAAKDAIGLPGNVQGNFKKAALERNIGIKEAGNFFIKIEEDNFSFESTSESGHKNYMLKMSGLIVEAGGEESNIQAKLDLCLEFNSKAEFIQRCGSE
jgi:hypothetical protein